MEEKKFVIVIPSYRNSQWAEKNIMSAVGQKYSNFKIIYTDDASPDGTADIIENLINKYKLNNVTLIKNDERKGALNNLYDMIWSCEDSEIIVNLDADDWLAHSNVLNRLNQEYTNKNIWLSYGSYIDYPQNSIGCAKSYEQHIINNRSFRRHPWRVSHLRTYYAALFKKIKKEDLMYQGDWADVTWDLFKMYPMIEMCGDKFSFISDILYIYNTTNLISDFRIKQERQAMLDRYIRNQFIYKQLERLF